MEKPDLTDTDSFPNGAKERVLNRPWIQVRGETRYDTRLSQVSFQRDHEKIAKLPPWYLRMKAENRTADEIAREAARRLRRAPTHNNHLVLGLILNQIGRTGEATPVLREILTPEFIRAVRKG